MKCLKLFTTAALLSGLMMNVAVADYPDRAIDVIVPYGAGGSTDVSVRTILHEAQKSLSQVGVVQNRGGGQATLGPAAVAKAKPDGYTIGAVTYSGIAITPHLMKVPYTIDDFEYIGAYGRYKFGLAVRADEPYKTLEEFIEYARTSENPVFFGTGGAPNNLAFFALGKASGAKFEQVNYKGGVDSVNALLGGQIEAVIQAPSEILPHVQSGKLRLLASASPMRWGSPVEDVKTFKEHGYDVEIDSWVGFIAPKGTPAAVRDLWASALSDAVVSEKVQQTLGQMGMESGWMDGDTFKRRLAELHATMPGLLKEAGMPLIE